MSCTAFWPSFVAKTACSKAISAILAGMAGGVTGAGAAASVAGGAGAAAGVWAVPAVVISPAASAETRTKVRFIRCVVLLQEIVTTKIDSVFAPALLMRFLKHKRLACKSSTAARKYSQFVQYYCLGAGGFAGVVVDGCGRVADGAEGTAGAATPDEAL